MLYSTLILSIRSVLYKTTKHPKYVHKKGHLTNKAGAVLLAMVTATTHAQGLDEAEIPTQLPQPFIPTISKQQTIDTSTNQSSYVSDTTDISMDAEILQSSNLLDNDTHTPRIAELNTDSTKQQNLQKLLDFYQPNPELPSLEALTEVVTDHATSTTQKLEAVQQTYNSTIHAPRCEGVWIQPQTANTNATTTAGQNDTNTTATTNNDIPQGTLHALADYGYYDNKNYAELSGNVVITQNGQIINADKVSMDLTTNTAKAEGQVLFTDSSLGLPKTGQTDNTTTNNQEGFISVSDQLRFDSQTGQAQASEVAFANVAMQAHGYARQLNKPNDTQYQLEDVMFTTCAPNDKKWHLNAQKIDLDTENGRGIAHNTTLNIGNIPVVYLPYFNFPIDDRRTSGLLIPTASLNTEQGLELEIPYYLNLAPNYDATISTRIFSEHNPMLTSEFRYLTNYGEGKILGTYLPKDKQYNDKNRSSLYYGHQWTSKNNPNLSASAEYNYVSDADYTNDFDELGINSNNANLPRQAKVNYFNDYLDAELTIASYQHLEATDVFGNKITDANRPFDKLPQLTIDYKLPWLTEANKYWQNLQLTGSHDSGYFKQTINDQSGNEKSGLRIYNQVSASYPLNNTWGYITPSVGFGYIYSAYDEDALQSNNIDVEDGSQSVFVPHASIDTGLNLYKDGAPFDWSIANSGYQMISPRLKYTYAPFKDQNNIPNFSTSVASVGYEQLFSDSWFLGHDRLQDLHAITPGINYRYIDANGQTRFSASMAQQFYLDTGKVGLDDIANETDTLKLFSENSSGLVTTISAKPANNVWIDTNAALTHNSDLNFFNGQFRYQPNDASLLSLGIIERKENANTNQLPLSALTASMVIPVTNKWRFMAQGQYDYENNKALESVVGLDYEDCCLGVSLYAHRYYNELDLTDKPTNSIMAELRFKGLSNGSKLVSLLSNRIYGFDPTQNAWKQ